jgi:Starter unit:ACP transacylase in aflatoxin biosynthesis
MLPLSSQFQTDLPSLLVFGPQTNLPAPEILAELRENLVHNPRLSELAQAIEDLPKFWETLTKFDPSLGKVRGFEYLAGLRQWLHDGAFPQYPESPPNVSALPLTVIMQILLYVRYLNQLQVNDPQRQILQQAKVGGAQGFCVGFLTALVIGCSENVREIAEIGAAAIRLAVCAGAYVDQDGFFAVPPNKTACIAVRWRADFKEDELAEILQFYQDARNPLNQTL